MVRLRDRLPSGHIGARWREIHGEQPLVHVAALSDVLPPPPMHPVCCSTALKNSHVHFPFHGNVYHIQARVVLSGEWMMSVCIMI